MTPPRRHSPPGSRRRHSREEHDERWRSRARDWPWSSSSASPRPTASRCRRGRTRSALGRRCPTSPASASACGRPTSIARGARLTCEPGYVGIRDINGVPAVSPSSFGF